MVSKWTRSQTSCVFEAGSFASCTANRNVTTAFAAKKGFIRGQPSEETGEKVSDLPS